MIIIPSERQGHFFLEESIDLRGLLLLLLLSRFSHVRLCATLEMAAHQAFAPTPFFFFSVFWPDQVACRILVPLPGTELLPPLVEAWCLNHWTTRKIPWF